MATQEPTTIVQKYHDSRSMNTNNQTVALAYYIPQLGRKTENPYLLLQLSSHDPNYIEVIPLIRPSPQERKIHDETIRYFRSEMIAFTPRKLLAASPVTPSLTTHISSNRGRMFLHGKPLYLKQNFTVEKETWIDPSKLTTLPTNMLHFSGPNQFGDVLGLEEESSYRLAAFVAQYKSNAQAWPLVHAIQAAMIRRSGWISTFGAWKGGSRRTEIEAEDVLLKGLVKELKALLGVVDDLKELEPKYITWGWKVEDESGIIEKLVTTKNKKNVFEGFREVEKSGEGDWLIVNEYGLEDESVRI